MARVGIVIEKYHFLGILSTIIFFKAIISLLLLFVAFLMRRLRKFDSSEKIFHSSKSPYRAMKGNAMLLHVMIMVVFLVVLVGALAYAGDGPDDKAIKAIPSPAGGLIFLKTLLTKF